MSTDVDKSIEKVLKSIENLMIKDILEYLRHGNLPNKDSSSFIKAYSLAKELIDKSKMHSEKVYKHYKKIISDFVNECKKKIDNDSDIISSFILYTKKIEFLIYWMNKIFIYLEKYYIRTEQLDSLSKSAHLIYKNDFFAPFKGKIYKGVNKLIEEDRKFNPESRPIIKNILKIFVELDIQEPKLIKENNKFSWISVAKDKNQINKEIITDWFNNHFKKETSTFIKNKANIDIQNLTLSEYFKTELKYLNEEKIRKKEYIYDIFHRALDKINYHFLIELHEKDIENSENGLDYMFQMNKIEDLKNAYNFINLHPDSLKVIIKHFQPYVKKKGKEIIDNKEILRDPKKLIPELIKLNKEIDELLKTCFDYNILFIDAKSKAFNIIMNNDIFAKQLSNYIDFCMKIGFKGKNEQEVDQTLDDIVKLFKFLNAKLAFQIDANKKMSDRLIKGYSLSTNFEKKLISKLKQEQGVDFVKKMTQMIKDLDLTAKEMKEYRELSKGETPSGMKFDVKIISQSSWEINQKAFKKYELMPQFFSVCVADFEVFYLNRHKGQKLFWCYGLSKLDIQYLCFENKNISVSTILQYLILLQLEKNKKLTIKKISDLLECNVQNIIEDLTGLIYNPSFNPQGTKDKSLIIGDFDEKSKILKESDEISFNEKFVFFKKKFQTLPIIKRNANEIKAMEMKEALNVKKYQDNILQASLTRIMKSRIGQITSHNWLVNETSKQIDLFKAQPSHIKENIEKLIEKNIIKRREKDQACYDYIA